MHRIWGQVGYRPTDTKLTFRGKNLGDRPLRYNSVHNEWLVNAYGRWSEVARALRALLDWGDIAYLHGYPSLIYEFARQCSSDAPDLVDELRVTLRGILFGSEFPAPVYRDTVEQVFDAPTVSWYGHSEMAILAPERGKKYHYRPFQTYGYCEAVADGDGAFRLVGTSYHNVASPFIRYDTGDLVTPAEQRDGLLTEFKIAAGRTGDFITDRNGRRISLTALIFGRHHPIFGVAQFVQVHQQRPGEATLLATLPGRTDQETPELAEAFDTTNVAITFRFVTRSQPVRTAAGKVPLLVSSAQLQQSGAV
jgi:phenylacetate-CoA ligase